MSRLFCENDYWNRSFLKHVLHERDTFSLRAVHAHASSCIGGDRVGHHHMHPMTNRKKRVRYCSGDKQEEEGRYCSECRGLGKSRRWGEGKDNNEKLGIESTAKS